MDKINIYNAFLQGKYGVRADNGHILGYWVVAEEMDMLGRLYSQGYDAPPPRKNSTITDPLDRNKLVDGNYVRQFAIENLKHFFPNYSEVS